MLTHGDDRSPGEGGAAALLRGLGGLRRRDRLGAAGHGAAVAFALTGAALTAAGIIHRHLAALPAPWTLLMVAATAVAAGAALPAFRPWPLAKTARRHDRFLHHDQLLPAALDAALERRPADAAVRQLVVRQGLERLALREPRGAAGTPRVPWWFFGAAAWLAALLLLAGQGADSTSAIAADNGPATHVPPLPAAPAAAGADRPAAPDALAGARSREPGPGSPATPLSDAGIDSPGRPPGIGPDALAGGRGAAGEGRGGAAARHRGPVIQRPAQWKTVTIPQRGTIAGPGATGSPAGPGFGAAVAGHDSAGDLRRPLRALAPADRLLVDAFLTAAPSTHD